MAGKNNSADNGSDIAPIIAANGNGSGLEVSAESGEIIDPSALLAELRGTDAGDDYARDDAGNIKRNKDGTPAKKRGRKSGGTTASKSAPRNNSLVDGVNTLSQTLMIVHMGIAGLTKFDQFALEEKEATALANSTVNVMKEFDITPDPRFTAIVGLVTTASMIYGPRLYNYADFRAEAKKKKAKEEAPIVNFNRQPATTADDQPAYNPAEFFASGNLTLKN